MSVEVNKQFKKVATCLSNLDKYILLYTFRNDGKIRSPTKTKLYNFVSGMKPELTYNEIRYILQYIDPEYQIDVEERLKKGLWNRDMKKVFGIVEELLPIFSSSSFLKFFNQKEKRTLGQKKIIENQQSIQEQLSKLINQNEEVKKLIPSELNTSINRIKSNSNNNIIYNSNLNNNRNVVNDFIDLDPLVYNDTLLTFNNDQNSYNNNIY